MGSGDFVTYEKVVDRVRVRLVGSRRASQSDALVAFFYRFLGPTTRSNILRRVERFNIFHIFIMFLILHFFLFKQMKC